MNSTFPLISEATIRRYKASVCEERDSIPEICGCRGAACRQVGKEEGANRALCTSCTLAHFAGLFPDTHNEWSKPQSGVISENRKVWVAVKHSSDATKLVPFSEIRKGDIFFVEGVPIICAVDAHECDDGGEWLLYSNSDVDYGPDELDGAEVAVIPGAKRPVPATLHTREVLELVNNRLPGNPYSAEEKLCWLREAVNLVHINITGENEICETLSEDAVLHVGFFCQERLRNLYADYVEAKIHYACGDMDSYNKSAAYWNSAFQKFKELWAASDWTGFDDAEV